MKRNTLIFGLGYLAIGIIVLVTALIWQPRIGPLLAGIGGGMIGGGGVIVIKYLYWTRPQHTDAYREKLEQEDIDLHDERKEQLRNKAGRYAYIVGLLTVCVSIIVIYILGKLNVIPSMTWQWMTIYLAIYVIVQYVLGIVIFRWLDARY